MNHGDEHSRTQWEKGKMRVPIDNGIPLLCGHVHNGFKTRRSSIGTPMVNVGVDVWDYQPILLQTALDELDKMESCHD